MQKMAKKCGPKPRPQRIAPMRSPTKANAAKYATSNQSRFVSFDNFILPYNIQKKAKSARKGVKVVSSIERESDKAQIFKAKTPLVFQRCFLSIQLTYYYFFSSLISSAFTSFSASAFCGSSLTASAFTGADASCFTSAFTGSSLVGIMGSFSPK